MASYILLGKFQPYACRFRSSLAIQRTKMTSTNSPACPKCDCKSTWLKAQSAHAQWLLQSTRGISPLDMIVQVRVRTDSFLKSRLGSTRRSANTRSPPRLVIPCYFLVKYLGPPELSFMLTGISKKVLKSQEVGSYL